MLTKAQFDVLYTLATVSDLAPAQLLEHVDLDAQQLADVQRDLLDQQLVSQRGSHLHITDQGREALAPYKVDNAVIMAAGISSRFVPISYEMPKGLMSVRGEVLIERQIRQLHEAGITDITVVVGYKAEMFSYLVDKLGVDIVYNPDYATRNNNATLWLVRDRLANTYVIASDYYNSENVFEPYAYQAYYAGVWFPGNTAEYAMETDEDSNILSVNTQGGTDAWCMLGHAYWDRAYSQQFVKILASIYDEPRTADMLWEDIYAEHCPELHMVMRPYSTSVIHEFDSLDELRSFDPDFINNVHSKVLTQITENLHCQRPEIKNIKPVTRTLAERSFRFEVNGKGYLYHYPDAETDHIIKPLPSQA